MPIGADKNPEKKPKTILKKRFISLFSGFIFSLDVKKNIDIALKEYEDKYEVMLVPNITNICYGRKVGYQLEKISLDEETEKISATDIRKKML